MTVDEARKLKKGDRVLYNGSNYTVIYTVLYTQERRDAHMNEPYVVVKCYKGNHVSWLFNEFISLVEN